MQPISSYNTTDAYVRLLLQGPPGSGKTTLALNFPNAYVVDMDVNLAGPLRYRAKRGLALPVGYDRLDIDENGKEVPLSLRFMRLNNKLVEVQSNTTVDTIILDSATALTTLLMEETKRLQPSVKDGRQLWGFFFEYGKALLATLTRMRKHVILIAHERLEKDEGDGTIKYRVSWPGQLGDIIGAFFTDVWRCEVASSGGLDPKYTWKVRTMPDYRFDLKNSFELPPTFEFDWKKVEEHVKGAVK